MVEQADDVARHAECLRAASAVTYDGMSERELDVLRLIAEGCSNREIGERLFISQHTAANHVRSILQKTGCANRAEAAAYAVHRQVVHQSSRTTVVDQ